MKKTITFIVFALFIISGLTAQMTVSGILDSTVSMIADTDSQDFSFGFEEFANLRFQSRLREGGTFFGAVNLIAASGIFAAAMAGMPSVGSPENFVAAIELERLHFRLRGEHLDFDGGLMRLPFGYGQVFGPSDFLNPRNPFMLSARPRGILGGSVTWFPIDELKLLGFFAAPRNPFSYGGEGALFGISADRHWDKTSLQALYTFEAPGDDTFYGIHRVGFSLKTDIEIGFSIETLYTYDHEIRIDDDVHIIDGLSFSLGADYSFFEGNLIILAEYLFNGNESSTALQYGGNYKNNHYLYTGFTWRFNDFTNMNAAFISDLDDYLFTPIITLNHELFQGVVFTISVQSPFDSDYFYGVNCTARVRLRF